MNLLCIILGILAISFASISSCTGQGISVDEDVDVENDLDQLRAELVSKVSRDTTYVADTAVDIAADNPGGYNINQICQIYDKMYRGWYYYPEKDGNEYFRNASWILKLGKRKGTIGAGDCDDFAILMASLVESLDGSVRITFAYDPCQDKNHAYADLYLGDEGDPQVEKLLEWLMLEYPRERISGVSRENGEVWLNLDYNSTHPGGSYFGEGCPDLITEEIYHSNSRKTPGIVPVIDSMDDLRVWHTFEDKLGSTIDINESDGLKGKAIEISYDLKDGGFVGIGREMDEPETMASAAGISLSYFNLTGQNTLKMSLVCGNESEYCISWLPETGKEEWRSLSAGFNDFMLRRGDRLSEERLCREKLRELKELKITIINNPSDTDSAGLGVVSLDHIKGVMAIPAGSNWASVEERYQSTLARTLSEKAERLRIRGTNKLPLSMLLATEAIYRHPCWEADRQLREGLALMPIPVVGVIQGLVVSAVAFSHDDRYLATAEGGTNGDIRIWDIASGKEKFILNGSSNYATWRPGQLAFSPHDNCLAIASENSVRVYNWTMQEKVMEVKNRDWSTFEKVEFSPDGSLLAAGDRDGWIRFWSFPSGQEVAAFNQSCSVDDISFSADGSQVATTCGNGTLNIWDMQSGEELDQSKVEGNGLSALSADGSMMVTVTSLGTARVWDLKSDREIARLKQGSWMRIDALDFSPDGKFLATGGTDKTVRVWDLDTFDQVAVVAYDSPVTAIEFCHNGSYLATSSSDGRADVWNLSTFRELLLGDEVGATSAKFSLNRSLLAIGYLDNTARVFNTTTGEEVMAITQGSDGYVTDVAISPDGSLLATSGHDNSAILWDLRTGEDLSRLGHQGSVSALAFSPDGKMLGTASQDKTARIWDVATGKEIKRLRHEDEVISLAFSRSGKLLATGSKDGLARVWDVFTGGKVAAVNQSSPVNAVDFSPRDEFLGTAGKGAPCIWDLATGKEVQRIWHDGDPEITDLEFIHEGDLIITASDDGAARVWNLSTREELVRTESNDRVWAATLSSDGRYMAAVSRDGSVRLWAVHPETLIDEACLRLTRNLTKEEWRQYLGDEPYRNTCPCIECSNRSDG